MPKKCNMSNEPIYKRREEKNLDPSERKFVMQSFRDDDK